MYVRRFGNSHFGDVLEARASQDAALGKTAFTFLEEGGDGQPRQCAGRVPVQMEMEKALCYGDGENA
jgi:hypothetical protein